MILFAYHYHTSKHRRYAMPVPFQVEPLYLSKSVTHVGSSMEVRDNLRRNPYAAKSPSHTVHPHTGVRIETVFARQNYRIVIGSPPYGGAD